MGIHKLIAWLCLLVPQAAMAQQPLFNSPELTDDELAEARGGFTLGSDIRVQFGAMITTTVDGLRVLQSQLHIDDTGVTADVSAIPGVNISVNGTPATISQLDRDEGTSTVAITIPSGQGASADHGKDFLRATIDLPDLAVQQILGREISSMIVNTADNRVVENHIAINVQLDNVQPLTLGSIGFRVQELGLEAALMRSR